MRKLKVTGRLLACCACAVLFTAAHAQTRRPGGWRRIVPLHSKRADVLRRLGKPRAAAPSYASYEFKDERAYVRYAEGDACSKDEGDGWNVPRGTVLSIVVTPRTGLRLSALRLDMRRYRKEPVPETPAHTFYRDEGAGLTYEVFEQGGADAGRIMSIKFEPSAKDGRLRCPHTD